MTELAEFLTKNYYDGVRVKGKNPKWQMFMEPAGRKSERVIFNTWVGGKHYIRTFYVRAGDKTDLFAKLRINQLSMIREINSDKEKANS